MKYYISLKQYEGALIYKTDKICLTGMNRFCKFKGIIFTYCIPDSKKIRLLRLIQPLKSALDVIFAVLV